MLRKNNPEKGLRIGDCRLRIELQKKHTTAVFFSFCRSIRNPKSAIRNGYHASNDSSTRSAIFTALPVSMLW